MGARTDNDEEAVLSEINVTPLVDVMLVLLIIFMIAAPMLHQGIQVALPKSQAERLKMTANDPLVISVSKDGIVYLMETPVHGSLLVEKLTPLLKSRQDQTVFVKGDHAAAYGKVVEVLDILRRGGIKQIGIVTEPVRTSTGGGR